MTRCVWHCRRNISVVMDGVQQTTFTQSQCIVPSEYFYSELNDSDSRRHIIGSPAAADLGI